MARVIVGASNLLRHARAHDALGAEWVEIQKEGIRLSLHSMTGRTELPSEGRWDGKGAMVQVSKLLAALTHIENQPIVLDLHDGMPCKLYAVKRDRTAPSDVWTDVVFDL